MIDWLHPDRQESAPQHSIEVAGRILPIALKRHRTAKRLILRLAPDGSEVRITMPQWGQSVDALEFAQSRSQWLADQIAKIDPATPPGPGGTFPFCGDPLTVAWDPAAPRKPRLDGIVLHLGGPEDTVQKRIERWLRTEALAMMDIDLAHYCTLARVPKPDLALSRAQRRWGSCSTSGTVRMNWRLIMAPELVRRSVVAHEVAHLIHFDHSPDFHALLEELFEGDIREANRWLKHEGRSLYAYFG